MLEAYQGKANVVKRLIGLEGKISKFSSYKRYIAQTKNVTCGRTNGATKRSSAAIVVEKLAWLFCLKTISTLY